MLQLRTRFQCFRLRHIQSISPLRRKAATGCVVFYVTGRKRARHSCLQWTVGSHIPASSKRY